ncbi:Protein maternal effect lethal 26 [Halotydeus destructor]|nr:Protein maternal effect lethal 26 [Halotydeus destructor]
MSIKSEKKPVKLSLKKNVFAEIIATNHLTHSFEVHCEYTVREDEEDEGKEPRGVEFKSKILMASFCQHITFEVNVTEDDTLKVELENLEDDDFSESTYLYKVDIVKCDGFRIDVTNRECPVTEHNADEYIRDENKVFFRFEVQILCSEHSRERDGLLQLYRSIDNDPSDFEIKTKDGSLKVTKNILLIKWNYFRTLTSAKGDDKLNSIWVAEGVSIKIMKDIVGFVYCNTVSFENTDHAMKLAEAGHRYLLDDLLADCSKYLVAELNMDNALPMLLLSDKYNLPALKEKCLILIPKALKDCDMEDMFGYDEFSQYSNRAKLIEACLQKSVRQSQSKKSSTQS